MTNCLTLEVMVNQDNESYPTYYGGDGHITSKKLVNPDNDVGLLVSPDDEITFV